MLGPMCRSDKNCVCGEKNDKCQVPKTCKPAKQAVHSAMERTTKTCDLGNCICKHG